MDFIVSYLHEAKQIIDRLDRTVIGRMLDLLEQTRAQGGRLFILGVGGSAANASHAVNDFRKLCGFEAYAPTDNVSELTARTNDEGWPTVFVEWLRGSRLNAKDAVLVLSVGGGSLEKNVSGWLPGMLELYAGVKVPVFASARKPLLRARIKSSRNPFGRSMTWLKSKAR